MIESAIFYPIAMFMGFIASQIRTKPINNKWLCIQIMIYVPLFWAIICYIYFPEEFNQGSLMKTLDSLFNTRHAFEHMGQIHRQLRFIYPLGAVVWFAAAFNLSGLRVGDAKDGNDT